MFGQHPSVFQPAPAVPAFGDPFKLATQQQINSFDAQNQNNAPFTPAFGDPSKLAVQNQINSVALGNANNPAATPQFGDPFALATQNQINSAALSNQNTNPATPAFGSPSTLAMQNQINSAALPASVRPNVSPGQYSGQYQLTPAQQVNAPAIQANAANGASLMGSNAGAFEAAVAAALANQMFMTTLGQPFAGIGPTEASLMDPLLQRGSLPNPGLVHQSRMIDNGQLTGLSVGGTAGLGGGAGGGVQASASFSGQPWYLPALQSGQGLINLAGDLGVSSQQLSNEVAIAQAQLAMQAEQINTERLAAELAQRKFQFGTDQFSQLPEFGSLVEALLGGTGGTGGSAIDTTSPFSREAAQARANQARGRAAASAASAAKSIADQMTGAGFGGGSPAIYANQLNALLQGAASGASNAEQIYSDYEDKNANFRLAAQIAAEESRARQFQNLIDYLGTHFSLLGQLFG